MRVCPYLYVKTLGLLTCYMTVCDFDPIWINPDYRERDYVKTLGLLTCYMIVCDFDPIWINPHYRERHYVHPLTYSLSIIIAMLVASTTSSIHTWSRTQSLNALQLTTSDHAYDTWKRRPRGCLGEGLPVYRIDFINILCGPQAPIIEELNMTLIDSVSGRPRH